MITIPMSELQFRVASAKLATEQGIVLSGRGGEVSKMGVEAAWSYDGEHLQINVTKTPFLISTAGAEKRIRAWLGGSAPGVSSTYASVVALVLCLSLLAGLTGCTSQQQKSIKQAVGLIGAEIPKIQPLITAASATADLILPADALLITGVTATVQTGLTALASLCNQYAQNPTDSAWQSIVYMVEQLEQQGASAILNAAHINNPTSRAEAQAVLGALQTALLIIDGFVQQARTPAQNQAAAQARLIKLEQIAPWLDRPMVEQATGHSFGLVVRYETAQGF